MPGFNPLLDYTATPDPGAPPTSTNQSVAMPARAPSATTSQVLPVGSAPLFGAHNTPLHVAILGLLALGVIVLLRKAGFRFAAVAQIGGR